MEPVPTPPSPPKSPQPSFDVRAKIDAFSTLLSRTIICFYQFLASDTDSEYPRRRLLDEYITVGGSANTTKILLDDSDNRKADGYLERRRKIEELWSPEGPLAQFAFHMENVYNIMSKAIEDHRKIENPTHRRGPFPIPLEMLQEEIQLVQEYKTQAATVLYDDFYMSTRKLDPKIEFALKIVEWIGFIDTVDRHECMSRQRHTGTCEWIFNPDVCKRYYEWWAATEGFLWIRGKAATGKSVILAAIVDEIFKELWEKIEEQEKREGRKLDDDERPYIRSEFFPAFYFFDFRDTRTLKYSTFIKCLFVQFLQVPEPDLAVSFHELAQQFSDGLPPPTDMKLFEDLTLYAMRSHEKKTIFVDGLNECDNVLAALNFLERAMQESNVRVIVSSRPEPIIMAQYKGRPTIDLEDYIGYTVADMRQWLMKRMEDHDRLRHIPPAKKIDVLDYVMAAANGSFWHAQCVVDSLEVCRSVAQVNEMIRSAPRDLETVHYNLLRRVNEKGEDVQTIVQMAIRWLGGALRPLSLSQIIEAVQIELGHTPPLRLNDDLTVVTPQDMLMLCGNVIKMDDRLARLGLGHSTVRTFLTQPPPEDPKLAQYFFDAHDIHRDLALRSITYMLADDMEKAIAKSYTQAFMFEISRRQSIIERCPMLTYVFDGGFEHLRYYTQEDDDAIQLLIYLERQIPEKPDKFREIFEALHDRTEDKPYQWILNERELVLGVLVRYGPSWMLKHYLLRRRDLVEGKEKLIKWAAKIGRFDHRDMLLEFELPKLVKEQAPEMSEDVHVEMGDGSGDAEQVSVEERSGDTHDGEGQ